MCTLRTLHTFIENGISLMAPQGHFNHNHFFSFQQYFDWILNERTNERKNDIKTAYINDNTVKFILF